MKQYMKTIFKCIFVLIIICVIVYTFRDSALPIGKLVAETPVKVILAICFISMVYQAVESLITMCLCRQYKKDFSYKHAFVNTFYASFYRVASLGSGAGVAAIVYLSGKGIPAPKACGLYSIEYALHKASIAILSGIFFLLNWHFMRDYFQNYTGTLLAGYAITLIVVLGLVLFAVSAKFHSMILCIVGKCNKKHRLDAFLEKLTLQCRTMEDASADLLQKKAFVLQIVVLNLIKLCCWYSIPYIIMYETGAFSVSEAIAVTAISVMLAAVIPVPAGIGSTELMLITLFEMIIGTVQAGAVSLLYRFATFVFPFLVGTVIVLVRRFSLQMHKGKPADEGDDD